MISRAVRSPFAEWWWTVDRWLLAALGILMVIGIVLAMAGSPPVAERLHLSTFHFVNRQVLYLIPASAILIATSFLTPRHVRRAALVAFAVGMALVVVTILFGQEVKGARRWIFGIQPSEFVKPAFVVLAAWAFSEGAKRRRVPGTTLAVLLLPVTVIPLMLQPDFGQTMLISLIWATLFFMAGLHWFWVFGIGGFGASAVLVAYKFVPHVRARILRFLDPQTTGGSVSDTFQVDTALDSFIAGGWFGKGPGEGTLKRILPDSHTDFIFAVTGEEFGIIACMLACFGVRFCRVPRPVARVAQSRSVLSVRDGGTDPAFWYPELHQYRRQPASHAGERHDPAICVLRRLVAYLACTRDGLPDRSDAQAAAL